MSEYYDLDTSQPGVPPIELNKLHKRMLRGKLHKILQKADHNICQKYSRFQNTVKVQTPYSHLTSCNKPSRID